MLVQLLHFEQVSVSLEYTVNLNFHFSCLFSMNQTVKFILITENACLILLDFIFISWLAFVRK